MNVVDELVVSLGLDSGDFQKGMADLSARLDSLDASLRSFASGVQQGFAGAETTVQGAGRAAQLSTEQAAAASVKLGSAAAEAGAHGAQGMARLGSSAKQAGEQLTEATAKAQSLGSKFGSFMGSLTLTAAAPLAAAVAAGKSMFSSYMSDVAQVAQMTGAYTGQMEEWRKKREMLSRVNRDDIELYRKGKLGLLDFNMAMAGLSTTVMRTLSPVMRSGITLLGQITDWVRQNEPSIVRFILVVAGTVTGVLVPSFAKMASVMLASPLTWFMAGLAALVLVIDDLVTYMQGGNATLGALWSKFGTGAEIAEKLGRAWESLKSIGVGVWSAVKSAVSLFVEYFGGAFQPALDAVAGIISTIASLLQGDFDAAIGHMRDTVNAVALFIGNVLGGAFNAVLDIVNNVLSAIENALGRLLGAVGRIASAIAGALGRAFESLKQKAFGWMPDIMKSAFGIGGDTETAGAGTGGTETAAIPAAAIVPAAVSGSELYTAPSPAALTAAAVSPAVSNSRTSNVTNDVNIGTMNVNTQATDADGIAREIKPAINRELSGLDWQPADGGVLQ